MPPNVTPKKVCLFGHFGSQNFGNEITLLSIHFQLHRLLPDAKVVCAWTSPERLAETRHLEAVPIGRKVLEGWKPRTPVTTLLRRVLIGTPTVLLWFSMS